MSHAGPVRISQQLIAHIKILLQQSYRGKVRIGPTRSVVEHISIEHPLQAFAQERFR